MGAPGAPRGGGMGACCRSPGEDKAIQSRVGVGRPGTPSRATERPAARTVQDGDGLERVSEKPSRAPTRGAQATEASGGARWAQCPGPTITLGPWKICLFL